MAEPLNDLAKDDGSIQRNGVFQKVPQPTVKLDDHSMKPITRESNIPMSQETRGVKTPEKMVAERNSLKKPGSPSVRKTTSESEVQNDPVTSKIPTISNTTGNLQSKLKTPKAVMKYTSDTSSPMSTPSSTPRRIIQQPRSIKKPNSKSDDLSKDMKKYDVIVMRGDELLASKNSQKNVHRNSIKMQTEYSEASDPENSNTPRPKSTIVSPLNKVQKESERHPRESNPSLTGKLKYSGFQEEQQIPKQRTLQMPKSSSKKTLSAASNDVNVMRGDELLASKNSQKNVHRNSIKMQTEYSEASDLENSNTTRPKSRIVSPLNKVQKESERHPQESNPSSTGKLKYSGFQEEQQIPKQRTLQMPKSSSKKTVSAASKLPITSRSPQVSKLPFSSRTPRKQQGTASQLSTFETSEVSQLKPRSFTRSSPTTKVLKYQSPSDKQQSVLQKRSTKSQYTSSCNSNDRNTPNTALLSQEPERKSEKCISATKPHVGPTDFILHDNLPCPIDNGCNEEMKRAKEVKTNTEKDTFPGNKGQRKEEIMDVVARLLERKREIECNPNFTTSKAHEQDNKISKVEGTREESDNSNKMSNNYTVPNSHLPDNATSRLGLYSGNSIGFTASNVSGTSKPTKTTSNSRQESSSTSKLASVKSASPKKTAFGYSKANTEQQNSSSWVRKVVVPSMAIQKAEEGIIKEPLKRSLTYPSNSGILQRKAIPKPSPKISKLRAPSQAPSKSPKTLPTPSVSQPHTPGQKNNQQYIKPSTSRNVKVVKARPVSSAPTVQKLAVPQAGKQSVRRASSTGSKTLSVPQSRRNSSNPRPSLGFTKLKPGQTSPSCRIVKPVIRPPSVKVEEQKDVPDIVVSDKDKVHSDSEEELTVSNDNVMSTYHNDVSDSVQNSTVESIIMDNTSSKDFYQQESGDAESQCKNVQSLSDGLQNLSEAEDVDFDSMWSEIAKESQMIRQDILFEAAIKPTELGSGKEDAPEVEQPTSFNILENNFNPKINLSDLENHQRCRDNLLQETCKENQFVKINKRSDKLYQTKEVCEDADSSNVRENEQCERFEIVDQNHMPNQSNLPSSKKGENEKELVNDDCPTVKRRMCINIGTASLKNISDLQQVEKEEYIHQSSDIKNNKPDVQVMAESSSVEIGADSSDENREFEEMEMQILLEEDSESSKISSSSPRNITCFQFKSAERSTGLEDMTTQPAEENGKGMLRTSNRGQSPSSISNIDNPPRVSFLSKSAPSDILSSNLNTQIKSTKARPPNLRFNLSQTTREALNSLSTPTPRKPLEGIDYTPPYAVNIPTSKYPIRNSQTCPTSPTFNWFPRDQEKTSLSDSRRRHQRQSKTSVRDMNHRRFSLPLSSFTCPSTPSFGDSSTPHHFIFPINEEEYNEDEIYYNYDLDLSSHMFHNLMDEKWTDLDTHLDDYNDRKDRSNSSSTDSSTHDSRRGSLLAKSKADWRLEPEELQHVLEKVKAEREREDRSSTPSPVAPSTDTRLRSRSFPRPRSWNGMTDSGIERANLKSARQMGMIKPQRAGGGGQVSNQDTFLETHLDFIGSSKKLLRSKKAGERKDYSPGSPTELAWPSPLQGFTNRKSQTSHCRDISRNGNQQNLSDITITVDSSRVINNNQISVHNHKTRSLPYNSGSSDVFENFNKGSDHLGPRCSTPAKNEEVQKYDELEPVQRRRSNSLTRAIDEGRLEIADETDLRPLDIENDFYLISQITEMNQKMLLNQSQCSSPQNELSVGENNSLSSSTNCLNRQVLKPTKRWSFIKESSKAGQRSAPASTRMTPVGTPLGSPGLKHKSLRPTKDSYSTLIKFMDYRQRADSVGQSDVERRTLSSRSKEKRKKIQSLLLDQSKSYQSHIGISSPDLLGTQQHSGSRTTVDGSLDISGDAKFMPKYSSLQRSGQRLHHKPVQKMYSDSLVNNNNQTDWPQKTHLNQTHKTLVRTSGVGRDVALRSSYSENDGLSERMMDQRQQMETNLKDSSDSSSLTSFESSIGNLSINSRSPSQATSTDISIERCDKTDASQNTSPVAKNTISTAVVIRRPKGRHFQRPKSMPNFDSYRVDSASNSSRESSRNMEEEKPPLKARPPKPRRAPRRSKSDLGGKNTIKAALKAAERAAMKEAAEQDAIEKAANEILMNAERLTEKEQFGTLTRRSSGSSMHTNGNIGDEEETVKEDAVVVRRNRRRGLVTRPISDLGPMNFDFNFNGDTTPPRNRKASIPTVVHKVDSPRMPIKRSQSIPNDLHKKHLFNVSNQLKSNGTTDRHPDVIPRHSQSTDTLAEDMCITMNTADDDVLVYGEALWDHVTMDEEELAFKAGDVIGVTDMQDKEWWWGQVDDQEGWFPSAFVRIRVNQNETVEEHFEKMTSGQINADETVRRTSMSFLSKRQVRTNVVMEILNTEKDYNKHLKDLCEGYVKQARKRPEMFSEDVIKTIFGNIEDIYVFQCRFLRKLTKRINQEEPHKSEIGSCFLKYKDGFSIYAAYCSNHSRAITELRQLLRRQRYKHFFEACRLLQAMIEIRIDGFLLTPVQRICKYPLQLAELLKYTGTDHPDYNNVKQALETMRNVAFEINEQKRLIENIEKIAQWQKSIEGWEGKDVLEVSTQSLHSGEVFKVSHSGLRKTGRVLFLFDHQLILCKRDILWRSQLVYKNRINLDSCTFQDVVDTKDIRNAWKTIDHESGKTYVFCTKSPEEKQKWLKAFHRERVLVHEEEERGVLVSSSAREAAMKNAALTEKPIKPSDTLLKRKVPLMPYEYQHEIIKPNVKRMVLPRGISSSDGSEVDTSKRRLLNWFFKGKR